MLFWQLIDRSKSQWQRALYISTSLGESRTALRWLSQDVFNKSLNIWLNITWCNGVASVCMCNQLCLHHLDKHLAIVFGSLFPSGNWEQRQQTTTTHCLASKEVVVAIDRGLFELRHASKRHWDNVNRNFLQWLCQRFLQALAFIPWM